jgi:non-heme chloroperoxidase
MMKRYTVHGGGDLQLHAREWGNPAGRAILFIHGIWQSLLCWSKQYESPLADEFRLVAFDNRGHGMSDKPLEPEHYTDGRLWADDVAAVLEHLRLERPVLVGWSYGGFVVCDYLREHGQDAIAGVHLVGGAVSLGESAIGTLIGPGFLAPFADITSNDLAANIDGLRRFLRGISAEPLPAADLEAALVWNAVVPPQVRANLAARAIDSDDVLAQLTIPTLVAHGHEDTVILPAMAEHVLAACRVAEPSWYPGVGHAPHMEAPERFNDELAAFVRRVDAASREVRQPVPAS